jgi:hypothetical protein
MLKSVKSDIAKLRAAIERQMMELQRQQTGADRVQQIIRESVEAQRIIEAMAQRAAELGATEWTPQLCISDATMSGLVHDLLVELDADAELPPEPIDAAERSVIEWP